MKKFKKIYIEITNMCNLNCSFCPKHKRKNSFMSCVQFETAVKQLHRYGDNFYLHVMGEPLSHPDLNKILNIADNYNIRVNITTNGTLLDKTSDILLNHNFRMVSVSLHSFEANSLNVSLEEYLDKVVSFCKKSAFYGVINELRLWNMDKSSIYNKNLLNGQIIDFLQDKLCLDFKLDDALNSNFFSTQNPNSRKKNLKLADNIYLGMAEHFDWPDISLSKGKVCKGFCYGLRNQIAVLADGTVVPCCLDSEGNIALGNIFENTLVEILSTPRSQKLYQGFTERRAIEPLCQTCGYMKKFIKN